MDYTKENIIYNVFEFIETKDTKFSLCAQEHLQILAKKFHITIKKGQKKDLKKAFKDFILNNKGYNETLQILYNAL